MNVYNQVDALMKRYEEGSCSEEEEQLVESVLFHENQDEQTAPLSYTFYKERLWNKLEQQSQTAYRRRRLLYYVASAATLCLLGFATYFYIKYNSTNIIDIEQPDIVSNDISPGGYRATLTLANGEQVYLDKTKTGLIVNENSINYSDRSSLGLRQKISEDNAALFELSTPRGGQYQITLSDGSRVWLNADSKLRYPNHFNEDSRVVYLEGEAYFEINEQALTVKPSLSSNTKKPFIVKTRQQEVRVLGTRFNINSYDKEIKTTLASGSLEVGNNNGSVIKLKPNEQALNTTTTLRKIVIDAENELAWRAGKFSFDNKAFSTIMDELARWYNIEVIYSGQIPKSELIGDAFRNQNISLILRLLDANNIKYRLDKNKRTLTIY